MKDYDLDHVFGDLVRNGSGKAVMTMEGKARRLDVVPGPNYRAMGTYAPKPGAGAAGAAAGPRNSIRVEPMAALRMQ